MLGERCFIIKLSYISLGNTAQRAEKRQAEKQSCLKERISGDNIALDPTRVQLGPEGLDVAFRRDNHRCRHPNTALLPAAGTSGLVLRSPAQGASAVVTGISFRDTRLEKSFIP